MKQEKGTTVNSWYRWFFGQDFIETLNKFGRLPLEMNINKLMTTMKEKDDVIEERDMYQAQFKSSLEEINLNLLDGLMDDIKSKSSREKVDLLCKVIDIIQTKNKRKIGTALQMIMDNQKVSEEKQKLQHDYYSKVDKIQSESLSQILSGDQENKDQLLIQFVEKIKFIADAHLH